MTQWWGSFYIRMSCLSEWVYIQTWPTYVHYISLHKLNHLTEFRTLDSSLIVTVVGFGIEQLEYQEHLSNHAKYQKLALNALSDSKSCFIIIQFLLRNKMLPVWQKFLMSHGFNLRVEPHWLKRSIHWQKTNQQLSLWSNPFFQQNARDLLVAASQRWGFDAFLCHTW